MGLVMGEFDNSDLFRQLFGTGDGQIFTGTMAECSQQQWMVNVRDGLSSRDQAALQNRQDYNNQLAGLSNAATSRASSWSDEYLANRWRGEARRKELERDRLISRHKRHWLLSWFPKSDPVIGRDFQPKKTLTEAEKAYWGV